jgi:membrane associated rhomboid family serine protease
MVANGAHLGGLLSGILIGIIPSKNINGLGNK